MYDELALCTAINTNSRPLTCNTLLRFFFKQKTAYEIMPSLVGSEMCIRDSIYIYVNAGFMITVFQTCNSNNILE